MVLCVSLCLLCAIVVCLHGTIAIAISIYGRAPICPIHKRDHRIGVCIGYESGMHRGTDQVITLSVNICMYVCMYVRTYVCMCICTCIYIYIYIYHIVLCIYVCVYIYIYIYKLGEGGFGARPYQHNLCKYKQIGANVSHLCQHGFRGPESSCRVACSCHNVTGVQ